MIDRVFRIFPCVQGGLLGLPGVEGVEWQCVKRFSGELLYRGGSGAQWTCYRVVGDVFSRPIDNSGLFLYEGHHVPTFNQ